jgi:hypothetical protein
MSEVAALVLQKVKVNGRSSVLSAFDDRLMLVNGDGTRTVPMSDLARIAHKAGLRTGRLTITLADGEVLVVRGLRSRDLPAAYTILVKLASAAQ